MSLSFKENMVGPIHSIHHQHWTFPRVPRQTYQEQLRQQTVSLQNAVEVERAQQGGTVWKRCFSFL